MHEESSSRLKDPVVVLSDGEDIGSTFLKIASKKKQTGGCILSFSILMMWSILLNPELSELVLVIVAFFFGCVMALTPFSARIRTARVSNGTLIEYRRPGVRWNSLIEAQIGSLIVFSAIYFFISQVFLEATDLVLLIARAAQLCTLLLVPLLPLIAALPGRDSMKTGVRLLLSDDSMSLEVIELIISAFDVNWDGQQSNKELQESIIQRFQKMILECDNLLNR